MGTGIGKSCQICKEQLNYDDGFDDKEEICNKCKKLLPKFAEYIAKGFNCYQ